MTEVDEFVNLLILEKGIKEADPDVLTQIKADLSSRIEDRINAMIVRELGEEKLPAFEKILEQSSEEAQKYVKDNVSDMDEKIAKELLAFRSIYIS